MRFGQSCRYLEHFTCTFAVTGCDDGSVNVQESALLEELVSSIGEVVSNASYRRNQFGTGTQVGVFAQILVGVAFCWQWVGCTVAVTDHLACMLLWVANLELKELTFCRTLDELAFKLVAGSDLA